MKHVSHLALYLTNVILLSSADMAVEHILFADIAAERLDYLLPLPAETVPPEDKRPLHTAKIHCQDLNRGRIPGYIIPQATLPVHQLHRNRLKLTIRTRQAVHPAVE